MAKLYGIDPVNVGGIREYTGPRDAPVWVRLCVKTARPPGEDKDAFLEADAAAWHIYKSTGKPTRIHRIGFASYAVEILLGETLVRKLSDRR